MVSHNRTVSHNMVVSHNVTWWSHNISVILEIYVN